jgi:3-phosphoshikimate 1-carboxyvinyltransferase
MNINPARSIRGRTHLPGDKSISTAIDCASTLSCLKQLGVELTRRGNTVEIQGGAELQKPATTLDCGNSGSTIRILSGILARQGFSCELAGDHSLNSRPMNRIIKPLELMGAKFDSHDGKPPLVIHGTPAIQAITYELPIASAQVKSAVLFAALGAKGRTQVKESSLSRDHTERLFNGFGVTVTTGEDLTVTIDGPAQLTGGEITVPGDASSAAYFVAAAMLLPDSELIIEGIGLNPTRAEFLSLLSSWGADISTEDIRHEKTEPIGTVKVRSGINSVPATRLIDRPKVPSVIDELPLLAVVGSQLEGGLEIRDAMELRHKESDRLKSTATNLRLMGAHVEEHPDGLTIAGPTKLHGASLDSFGDHRIAMAFTVAALIADGPTEIAGADCVNISFPEFFDLLDSVTVR